MWLSLLLGVLACVIMLYAPGYFMSRALHLERYSAVVTAPAFSLFAFTLLGITFQKACISCPAWMLFIVALIIYAAIYAAVWGVGRARGCRCASLVRVPDQRAAWKYTALYVGIALLVVSIVFIGAIHTPDGFCRRDDNTFHFAVIRGFLDTGTYSLLNVSSYLDLGGSGSFYPAAWHVIVAMVASLIGNAVTISTNACIIAFISVVFPPAVYLFLVKVFGNRKLILFAGAFLPAAFSGFPWGFLVRGQLGPNMISWMMIPIAIVLLMELVNTPGILKRISLGIGFVISIIAVAFGHPNGIFVFGIWAVFWAITRFFYDPREERATVTPLRIVGAIVFFIAACGVWYMFYTAPQLMGVVGYMTLPRGPLLKEIVIALSFRFSVQQGVQPLFSLFALIGVIYTLKHRRYLWMSIALGVALVFFIIDASFENELKLLLTGFWYCDATRTGAMASFFGIPVVALGFAWSIKFLSRWLKQGGAIALLVILLGITQFLPLSYKTSSTEFALGLEKVRSEISIVYSWDEGLTDEEHAFVQQVCDIVPEGVMVINTPHDGSCWSYGIEGINTYFRRCLNRGFEGQDISKVLRLHLKDVAKNKKVQKILKDLNAQYFMILDDPSCNEVTRVYMRYEPENWTGMEPINEKTPGFTLVLSEGDMRLYRIDY